MFGWLWCLFTILFPFSIFLFFGYWGWRVWNEYNRSLALALFGIAGLGLGNALIALAAICFA